MRLDEPVLQIERPGQGIANEWIVPVCEGLFVERRGFLVLPLIQKQFRFLE